MLFAKKIIKGRPPFFGEKLPKSLNPPTHPRVFVRYGDTKGEIRVKKKDGVIWGGSGHPNHP